MIIDVIHDRLVEQFPDIVRATKLFIGEEDPPGIYYALTRIAEMPETTKIVSISCDVSFAIVAPTSIGLDIRVRTIMNTVRDLSGLHFVEVSQADESKNDYKVKQHLQYVYWRLNYYKEIE